MDNFSYRRAREALRQAHDALNRLDAISFEPSDIVVRQVMDAWADMLIYGNRVFAQIEQGTKVGPNKGWYDGIKNLRRSNMVLRYMQHARNADEHTAGASLLVVNISPEITIPANLPPGTIIGDIKMDAFGNLVILPSNPNIPFVAISGRTIEPQQVVDRGITYEVPKAENAVTGVDHLRWLGAQFLGHIQALVKDAGIRAGEDQSA